jgi:autotransporter adhesin
VDPTDAANVSQVTAVQNQVNANSYRIGRLSRRLDDLEPRVAANTAAIGALDKRVTDIKGKAYSGVAAAATLDTLVPPSAPGKTTLMGGVAHYEGESAVGVNLTHHVGGRKLDEKKIYVNGGVSVTSESTVLTRAMVGFEF